MRVVAAILGLTFVVLPIVAIATGDFKAGLIFGFVMGPALLAYAWGGQKALERWFPQFAEVNRHKKKKGRRQPPAPPPQP